MISNNSSKILSVASKKDLKNDRKRISENNHAIINLEISSAENLENQDLSMKTHTCQKFKNIHRAIYIPNFGLK